MATSYYELRLEINPEMEDVISEIFFDNFDCDGVILAEEAYNDAENMISTTQGACPCPLPLRSRARGCAWHP